MATVTQYPSANNGGWDANEANAYADDGAYATTAPGVNSTQNVEYGNFGFDAIIPAGATITSVTINAQWKVSTTASSATFRLAGLISNVVEGTEHTDTSEPTSDKTTNFAMTSLPTRDELLDGVFEVRVGAQRGAGATGYTMSLDYVSVTVVYTAGAYTLTCDAGSFTHTGQVVALLAARKLTADYGGFTHTGQTVALLAARKITADYGAFALTGQDVTLTYTPVGGGAIIDIDHEEGDLSEYTSTVNPDGDELNVTEAAALAGTNYGLAVTIDDTDALYGQYAIASPYITTGVIRARAYIDPNSLTMADYNNFVFVHLYRSTGAVEIGCCYLRKLTNYQLYVSMFDDAYGEHNSAYITITDAPHYLEFKLTRATNSSSSDGSLEWWIDGVEQTAVTGKDNYDLFSSLGVVRFGACAGVDAGTSGTFYLDELVVNDTGDEIGPISGAYSLTCDAGSFTHTGQTAGLLRALKLVTEYGAFTHTGQTVTLRASRLLTAVYGSFTHTGQVAILKASRLITAVYGSFALTGQDVTLTYTPGAGAYNLVCDAGGFALTGQTVALRAARLLTATYGAFTYTGQVAGLLAARKLVCDNGSYLLTGQNAILLASRLLTASAGSFTHTGQNVTFIRALIMAAVYTLYTLSGQDVTLTFAGASTPGVASGSDGAIWGASSTDALVYAATGTDALLYAAIGSDALSYGVVGSDASAGVASGSDAEVP